MVILLPNTFPILVYMKRYFVLQRVLCLALEYVVAEMDSFATVHKRPDSEIDTHKTYCITPPPPHRHFQDLIPCSLFTLFRRIGNRLVLKLVS